MSLETTEGCEGPGGGALLFGQQMAWPFAAAALSQLYSRRAHKQAYAEPLGISGSPGCFTAVVERFCSPCHKALVWARRNPPNARRSASKIPRAKSLAPEAGGRAPQMQGLSQISRQRPQ